ncbi:MAG: YbaB/EbfC family nucleoid-associated protein [Patescibacteria group bacterium]|nr:YbaB/EbfC family nucleoid-associated protein [Patescibacteria group bacterium]
MILDKAKRLYNLKKKADKMKKKMRKIEVDTQVGNVRVVMRGDQSVKLIEIDGKRVENVEKALNKASNRIQKKVAKQMQGQMGDLGIPGL